MTKRSNLLAAAALCLFVGCDRGDPIADPLDVTVEFEAGTALVISETDTITLNVDIAESNRQQQRGLMERTSLAPDEGMIFLYMTEQPAENAFYMYNTLIPLSIAFMDASGRIGSIRHMEPCTSPFPQYCTNYAAGVPFWSALEVNQGFFEEHGIGIGDRVILQQ